MLDENLPTFYLKSGQEAHLWSVLLCQYGNDPNPAYYLRYPNPTTPESKNRYAAALYDPYIPDVVYGEVLIVPEWTQPTLSAEAIRQNGGVAPPPEPILPSKFTIQLYNPDQQITVHYKPKTWNSPATWSFEMPQNSFREPSGSSLDRTRVDPSASDFTPKLRFSWRKDSKLSKDLTCLLSGKTTSVPETKTKSKEPDITISIFKGLRELTLYEPNLYRVEMEDFKGLEVVLLLGAITIRDVYFTALKDAFRVSNPPSTSTSPVSNSPTTATPPANKLPVASAVAVKTDIPPAATPPVESPQHRRQLEQQRREEKRRTKKMMEQEEKARRKREEEVDRETRRLQKLYGEEEKKVRSQTPAVPPRPTVAQQSVPPAQPPRQRPAAPAQRYYHYHNHTPSLSHGGTRPYTQLPAQVSTATLLAPPRPQLAANPSLQPKRSSFFGFRRRSSEDGKLSKKRSSMF